MRGSRSRCSRSRRGPSSASCRPTRRGRCGSGRAVDVAARPRARAGHRPRRRGVRRRRPGERRPARRRVGALRPHVERRGRHRARAADDPRARPRSSPRPSSWSRRSPRARASSATRRWSGRTHGIHAEPTTFGMKLALWAMQVRRDRERLQRARATIAVGKLSGAVGTFSNIDPAVERYVCERLGLTPVPATQVLPRDRHAEVLYACTSMGASIESFALEIRHLQRTEVREAEEAFREGQKGSSAMPHKRNPIKSEQLCGLAPSAARQSAGRARRRRVVARARHLALVGRAHHHPRLADARLLRDRADDEGHLGPARVSRAHAAQPRRVVRSRVQPAGAARARRGRCEPRRRVPDRCSATRCRPWQEERSFRELLVADPDVRPCSTRPGSTRAST